MMDTLSLFIVTGATGLLLGMSVPLAIDAIPIFRKHNSWIALIIIIVVWAIALFFLIERNGPEDATLRRLFNATAELWVAFLLWRRYGRDHNNKP